MALGGADHNTGAGGKFMREMTAPMERPPPSPGVESAALRTELAEALEVGERYGATGRSWFEGGHGFLLEDRTAFAKIAAFLTAA